MFVKLEWMLFLKEGGQNFKPWVQSQDGPDQLIKNILLQTMDDENDNDNIMKRSKSFETETETSTLIYSRNLETQLRTLQREVASLKRKVTLFEEQTNRNFWGTRYSRRMAVTSNLLLGLWIFWGRFLKQFQKHNKSSLLGVISPLKGQDSLKKVLLDAYSKAFSKSWVFFVGN